MNDINAVLIRLPNAIDGSEVLSIYATELTERAKMILQDPDAIEEFSIAVQEDNLPRAWASIVQELENETNTVSQDVLDTGTGLARLCRNVLVGNSVNKWAMRSCETLIRRGIFLSTSFGSINEERFRPFQRASLQVIANLLAPVKQDQRERQLAADLISAYIQEEDRSHQIVLRSVDSKDSQVLMSALTIVLNALRTDPGLIEEVTNRHGTKILAKVLDRMDSWSSLPPGTLEERCFNLSYELFVAIVNNGKQARVYGHLGSPDDPMTPSQIVFLRLLDGYMHGSNRLFNNSEFKPEGPSVTFLVPVLLSAATYAESSLRALAKGGPGADGTYQEDPGLNRTLEGSVLLNQCLIASALQETPVGHERELIAGGMSGAQQVASPTLLTLRSCEDRGNGLIEIMIALLGALEALFPSQKRPRGTPLEGEVKGQTALRGFITLKRDIVQLLGLIVYNDRTSQDRVRLSEGIHLILSLCIVDEENPFIREHALLTIRNLMVNNPENQAVVGTMDPIGMVGPDGELIDMPKKVS